MVDQDQEPTDIDALSSEEQLKPSPDSTNLFTTATECDHPLIYLAPSSPCTPFACCRSKSNYMKRPSPSSSSSLHHPSSSGAATHSHSEPRPKKLFRDQEDLALTGFSTISFPVSFGASPCPRASASASGLAPSLKRCASDPAPSPAQTFCRSPSSGEKGVDLTTKEEASNSMRLRRMKDCLREMRKWWDEVMQEDEEEEDVDDDDPEGAEADNKVLLSKDDCGVHAEEAVRVEWAEKCLSICFKCPCTKGYQILLSGNNCYYKLV